MAVNKRLAGFSLLAVAIAAFLGALVTDLIWDAQEILLVAIALEALALIGLILLMVWPSPDFDTGDVNPELIRCPRCSTVFDPPKRGGQITCPTCGLEAKPPRRRGSSGSGGSDDGPPTERAKDDVLS